MELYGPPPCPVGPSYLYLYIGREGGVFPFSFLFLLKKKENIYIFYEDFFFDKAAYAA